MTQAAQAQSEAKAAARSAVAAQADAQSAALAVAAATAQAVEAEAAVAKVEQDNAANAQKRARIATGHLQSSPPLPQYSMSYAEVMGMLTNGESPPGSLSVRPHVATQAVETEESARWQAAPAGASTRLEDARAAAAEAAAKRVHAAAEAAQAEAEAVEATAAAAQAGMVTWAV